jgi:monoamine oxidase
VLPSVLVIGDIISGLAAARTLQEEGIPDVTVTVLEASPERVGGRMWSMRVGGNAKVTVTVDVGGASLHVHESELGRYALKKPPEFPR